LTIFSSTKVTNRLQTGLATVQENGRYALHLLVKDIRGAGFLGCAGALPTIVNIVADLEDTDIGMTQAQAEELIEDLRNARLFTGGTAASGNNPFNAVEGTDWIEIRGGQDLLAQLVGQLDPNNANIQTTPIPDDIETGDLLLISDCESMDLFCAGNSNANTTLVPHPSSCNLGPKLSKAYGEDAVLLRFRHYAYFVRQLTGRTNNAGDPIRALFRRDEVTGNDVELVDGIEDLQITYGVDGDGNGLIDQVKASADMVADDWGRVLSVRATLQVSSVDEVIEQGAASDLRVNRPMVATAAIRNRLN
jgi:type IV pilus assembly protein PilW